MVASTSGIPGVPQTGEVLAGKYRVEDILGVGGMGAVLAAWHLVLERRVAIKFLLPAAMELPDADTRFVREARAVAALQSRHVASVLDVGTLDGGAPYLVMEHLAGADFSEVIRQQGPLAPVDVVDLLLQAMEALAEAHARGIIHRDLKPKNLFLTSRADGAPLVKVLDFGLSKITAPDRSAGEASLTAPGLVMGSIHYMAPEQIRSIKYADVRTDIWALGVILYEMVTGQLPFRGESVAAVLASILTDAAPQLSAFQPDVPAAFQEIVACCLRKDPARRPQRVADVARALAPFGSPASQHLVESILRLGEGLRDTLPSVSPSLLSLPGSGPGGVVASGVGSRGAGRLAGGAGTAWHRWAWLLSAALGGLVLAGAGLLAWRSPTRLPAEPPAAGQVAPSGACEATAPAQNATPDSATTPVRAGAAVIAATQAASAAPAPVAPASAAPAPIVTPAASASAGPGPRPARSKPSFHTDRATPKRDVGDQWD